MSPGGVRGFAQVVRSSPEVRSAFSAYRPMRLWWRVILWLHGKPSGSRLPDTERARCVARGFAFYALLYRLLGILFLGLAPALWFLLGPGGAYPAGLSLLAGGYLWVASGLAYTGSAAYAQREPAGTVMLVTFLVMVTAFLGAFVSAVSVIAQQWGLLPTWQNLFVVVGLVLIVAGSDCLELVFLVTERPCGNPQGPSE